MSVDIFAKRPALRLPNGKKKYNTCIGYLCSMIFFAAIVGFIYFTVMQFADMASVKTLVTKY